MKPDPDHLEAVTVTDHIVRCMPGAMPYERYSRLHRKDHDGFAHQFLNRLANAGWTLTTLKEDSCRTPPK